MMMYEHYAAAKGWGWSPLAVSRTECDGVREASVGVSGEGPLASPTYHHFPETFQVRLCAPQVLLDA